MKRALILAAWLAVGLLVGTPAVWGSDVESQVEQAHWRRVIDRATSAYIFIGGGSGAIISHDGYALTNNHVVGTNRTWRVKTAAGKSYVADVVGVAPGTDLALLKLRDARNVAFLPLGDSDKLAVGEQVVAIGNPFALGNSDHIPTVTVGVVSAVGINGPNVGDTVVTDTPINPGNSGGPLVNRAGELVGVNYGQMPSRFGIRVANGSGYAISANQVKRFLEPLKKAKGGQVGVGAVNGAKFDVDNEGRVTVRAVEQDSPAGHGGLAVGDRVVAVGPWPVFSLTQMYALAERFPAASRVALTVLRDQQRRELTVLLDSPERVGFGVVLERASATSLKVEQVLAGSPAHRAGIRRGDVLVGVAQLRFANRTHMQSILGRLRPGQRVPLTLTRAGQSVTVSVELAGLAELQRLLAQASTQPDTRPDSQPDEAPGPASQPTTRPATRPTAPSAP